MYLVRARTETSEVYLTQRDTWVFPIRIDSANTFKDKETAEAVAAAKREHLADLTSLANLTIDVVPA